MSHVGRLALVAVLGVLASTSVQAQETRHAIRVGVTYASPTGDQNFSDPFDYEGFTFENEFDGEIGGSVSYEYRFSERVGLEFGATYVQPDLQTRILVEDEPGAPRFPLYDTADSARMLPLTVGLNIHLAGAGNWSLYVAPELAYILYDDAEQRLVDVDFGDFVGTFRYKFDDELTWGAKLGFDWGFTPNWGLTARVSYLNARAEIDTVEFLDSEGGPPELVAPYNGRKLDPKPILFTVGVAYRF